MPQFILSINLGNDGMISATDVKNALIRVSENIERNYPAMSGLCAGSIRDINGNVVGHYEVV